MLNTRSITGALAALVIAGGVAFATAPADAAPASFASTHRITVIAKSPDGVASLGLVGNGASSTSQHSGTRSKTFAYNRFGIYQASAIRFSTDGSVSHVECIVKVGTKVVKHVKASGTYASAICTYSPAA